jgi:RHS repeat-associated protein
MTSEGSRHDGLPAVNYNYFRDYDPQVGRYLESDPIGIEGGLNTYGYVGANPLVRADVNGLFAFWRLGRAWTGGNGNLLPGYERQDWECSTLFGTFLSFGGKCAKRCCVNHDLCYQQFGCNWSSWFTRFGRGNELPCNTCNALAGC